MRTIDMETWPRRRHYETFRGFHNPHFDMCANVALTVFRPSVKQSGVSLTITLLYVLTRAANDIPEFRLRIHGDSVIEHDVVHPSCTILVDEDLFSFCTFDYDEDFDVFASSAAQSIAEVKADPWIATVLERDDLLYMSAIPWVAFTSFTHPVMAVPADSVPRMAWGKVCEEAGRVTMPLQVEGHHALMDGLHAGRYYEAVQGYLDDPWAFL